MIDRRTLIGSAAALAALPRVAAAKRLNAIGLQLYTLRELFQKDPVATLEAVARIGYREVEFGGGGYEAIDAAMLRRTMDRLQLRSPSVHIGYDALLGDFAASVERAKTLGADTVVLPYMTEEHRTLAGWTAALPKIARLGADLSRAGLGLAYHNHDFEFTAKPEGVSLYERLLKATDPRDVRIELDLYWARFAGQDVPALIDRLGARLYAFHVKDMRANRDMAAVGQGTIDFAALFARKGAAGVRHFYVENDRAPAPYLPDITTSFTTLGALRF